MTSYEVHQHNLATKHDEVIESFDDLDAAECCADTEQLCDTCADHVYDVHIKE